MRQTSTKATVNELQKNEAYDVNRREDEINIVKQRERERPKTRMRQTSTKATENELQQEKAYEVTRREDDINIIKEREREN